MLTKAQKRNRTAWRNLLYSGEYTQETGHLKTNFGHCCLGVACEIPGAPAWGSLHEYAQDYAHQWDAAGHQNLSEDIGIEKFGLSNEDQGALTWANDHKAMTFEEIADVLYLSEVSWETVRDISDDMMVLD